MPIHLSQHLRSAICHVKLAVPPSQHYLLVHRAAAILCCRRPFLLVPGRVAHQRRQFSSCTSPAVVCAHRSHSPCMSLLPALHACRLTATACALLQDSRVHLWGAGPEQGRDGRPDPLWLRGQVPAHGSCGLQQAACRGGRPVREGQSSRAAGAGGGWNPPADQHPPGKCRFPYQLGPPVGLCLFHAASGGCSGMPLQQGRSVFALDLCHECTGSSVYNLQIGAWTCCPDLPAAANRCCDKHLSERSSPAC